MEFVSKLCPTCFLHCTKIHHNPDVISPRVSLGTPAGVAKKTSDAAVRRWHITPGDEAVRPSDSISWHSTAPVLIAIRHSGSRAAEVELEPALHNPRTRQLYRGQALLPPRPHLL